MKIADLQIVGIFLLMVVLSYVLPFSVFRHVSTFVGGFLYFTLIPVLCLAYIVVYTKRRWLGGA